jgi:histidine triad (HIT) family protein
MTCLFCRIAAGEIPSEKVLEDEHAFAFLDIRPLTRGHVLVIPKRHSERVADMPVEDALAVMRLVQRLTRRQGEALGAAGVTIAVNDGRAAGQEVLHVHVHLIPRHEKDGAGPIHRMFPGVTLGEGELREIGAKLRG